MDVFSLIILIILLILLSATFLMTAKSNNFWRMFLIHSAIFLFYMTFVLCCSKLITGHDEYGVEQIGLGVICIVVHIVIGFAHGLYVVLMKKSKQ